jgi:ferritin-like metal-binding protein YciE
VTDSGTLHDAFIDELRDAYDAEKQVLKALPKMSHAAAAGQLRAAFDSHLGETKVHVERLEQVFAGLGEKVRGKHCDGVAGIIEEGKSVMEEDFDEQTMDACLIAAAQRVEHYEMAAYGTLVAWARALGHPAEAGLLEATLNEEKAADEKLTSLAERGINSQAAKSTTRQPAVQPERKTQKRARVKGSSRKRTTRK